MQITEIEKITMTYHRMSITDGPYGSFTEYIRHSSDNWDVHMGESTESVFRCDVLEAAFQALMNGVVQ